MTTAGHFGSDKPINCKGAEAQAEHRQLFISGQGASPDDGCFSQYFKEQAEQALDNLTAALRSAQMCFSNLVQIRCYITERQHFTTLKEVLSGRLSAHHKPAITVIIAELVNPDRLVEIEAIAAVGSRPSSTDRYAHYL